MHTDAVSEGPLEAASDKGNAAFFYSTYAATSGDVVLFIKSTEADLHLHITRFILTTTVDARFDVFEVTSGTAAGTTLTYQNPNFDSGSERSSTLFGNAAVTGSLTGNTLFSISVLANTTVQSFIEGAIQLRNDDQIAVSVIGTSPTVYVTIIGFWSQNN